MKQFALISTLLFSSLGYAFDPKAPFLTEWDKEMDIAKKFAAPPSLTLQTTNITTIHGFDPDLKQYRPIKIEMPNKADYCEVIPVEEIKNSKEPLENYFLPKDANYYLTKKVTSNLSLMPYKTIIFPMGYNLEVRCKFLRKEDLAAVEMDKKSCLEQDGVPGTTYRPQVLLRSITEFDSDLKAASKYESCVLKAKPTSFAQVQAAFKKHDLIFKYKEFGASSQGFPPSLDQQSKSSPGTK